MNAAEIFVPLQRMFEAMEKMCIRTTEMRARYGRWNVPVTKAECTVIWFALGVKPEPGVRWPRFPVNYPKDADARKALEAIKTKEAA